MNDVIGTLIGFAIVIGGTILIQSIYNFIWNRLPERTKNKNILKQINKAFNGKGVDE